MTQQDAGINHKEFGVTSEGVVVYLDVALRSVLNINPHKYVRTHTHSLTYTYIQTYTFPHTCTHTHTLILSHTPQQ